MVDDAQDDLAHAGQLGGPAQVGEHGVLLGAAGAQPRGGLAKLGARVGHEAVRDDAVDADPLQRQRGQGPPGLGGDDAFGRQDQPDARRGPVGEHRAQRVEVLGEPAEGVGGGVPLLHGGRARDTREQAADHAPVGREEAFEVAGEGLGEREQPQRVDDHRLPRARVREPVHLGEREELLDAGQDGQLLRVELVDSGAREDRAEVAAQVVPGVVDEVARVDLGGEQSRVHFGRSAAERDAERVAEGVRGVGRDDQRLAAVRGELGGGGGGQRRLADAALAGEEQDARHPAFSTRRLSSLRAVSMIIFSALRRKRPIIGTTSCTDSVYVTSVLPPLGFNA